ncbi:hypothetical protein [Micromonospora thermarum]|uniref:Uncharacterized protein n=1 Tax=Micromonospora thermarum TaxID=2720024 RepID=A0ABX0Z927_9ACTN|nr:hypothetical protein [Micromonospora thermarum]NJP34337.1 hypothetical protein [Micromonospora thermarum]
MTSELDQLAEVTAARARLDEQELTLIDRARQAGATWAQIAAALGLASRQAAEQRRQRLATAARARRVAADRPFGPQLTALRAAVAELDRWIAADRRWDERFPRAPLVRRTVTAALDAPPGPLHSLARHVVADVDTAGPDRVPARARTVAAAIGAALSTAR